MALTPCAPCNCIPGVIGVEKFKQDVEIILCNILTAIEESALGGAVDLTGINGVAPSVNNGAVDAGTLRVTLANDSTGQVRITPSTTPAQSSVAGSASNVTLLAANSSRRGATIFNDSTATLYLKLGATASTTSYTVQLTQNDYYEVPFGYTGIIDGIWGSATGNARITELT